MRSRGSGGSLDPQGPAAETIAGLWWLMLGLGTAVFVLFAVLLGIALVRRSPSRDAAGQARLVNRWVLGGGVAMPVVVLIVVFAATVAAMQALPKAGDAREPLVIEVTGHQWWYEVGYPEQGIATRELHMPVGRPVEFRLTSADVIHSFWIPALGGKMDMLPDGENILVLQADEPGEHTVHCAEFCGLHHTRMRLRVMAEPEADFAAWAAAQT